MKILMFIVMLLFVGAFFIISQDNLSLKEQENRHILAEKYYAWTQSIFSQAGELTGYVVRMNWLPDKE